MFSVAICDNEAVICSSLEKTILEYEQIKYGKTKSNIEMFYDGNKLIEYITQGNRFDLIFLDIEMNGINGVEVGKYIRKQMNDYITQIVYISGKQQYAMELFQNQPLNFLLKPIDENEVINYLEVARRRLDHNGCFFEFMENREYYRIPCRDILYFEVQERKIRIITTSGIYYTYKKLNNVKEIVGKIASRDIENCDFISVHKSYYLNFIQVISYSYEEMKMSNGDIVPISRSNRKNIRDYVLNRRNKNE